MSSETSDCPLCRKPAVRSMIASVDPGSPDARAVPGKYADEAFRYNCDGCSRFVISCCADEELRRETATFDPIRHKLAALIWEHKSEKRPIPWLQIWDRPHWPLRTSREQYVPVFYRELLTRWPQTFRDKIDRILCALARDSETPGRVVCIYGGGPDRLQHQQFFAQDHLDAKFYLDYLKERDYLRPTADSGLMLGPAGWARIDEIERTPTSPENPVFVAMWFGGTQQEKAEMNDLYRQQIEPAVKKAGYKVSRADLEESNDFVMDKVLTGIRAAPYVVADFTGNRGGVYFEAGFARGLGIPVIHTSRHKDFRDDAHFNVKQIDFVLWEKPQDLSDKLYYRIVRTVGYGPHPAPEENAEAPPPS